MMSQHAQVSQPGEREAVQDKDLPLTPGASAAAAAELENPGDAAPAGAGAFTLLTAGLTLLRRGSCWGSIPQLWLVGEGRVWWTRTQRPGSYQHLLPFLLQ